MSDDIFDKKKKNRKMTEFFLCRASGQQAFLPVTLLSNFLSFNIYLLYLYAHTILMGFSER